MSEKPSLGVIPEKFWLESRCQDLARAIAARLENGANARQECVDDWTAELQRHLMRVRQLSP